MSWWTMLQQTFLFRLDVWGGSWNTQKSLFTFCTCSTNLRSYHWMPWAHTEAPPFVYESMPSNLAKFTSNISWLSTSHLASHLCLPHSVIIYNFWFVSLVDFKCMVCKCVYKWCFGWLHEASDYTQQPLPLWPQCFNTVFETPCPL